MKLKNFILEYLEKSHLMQVATANNNQPWACTLHFAFDKDFNLFWISTPLTRHSQEIYGNEKVAGTIVASQLPGDKSRGIQFEGYAKRLTGPLEMKHAVDVYAKRMKMDPIRKQKILHGEENHVPYQITPTLIVLFDVENFPENPRQEYTPKP